jgi:hypothetical protein
MMLLMRAGNPSSQQGSLRGLRGSCTIFTIFIFLVMALSPAAYSQTAPPSKTPRRLASALKQTLTEGKDAILPPHISHLLGISPGEQEVSVKQFVQMGEVIRGLEVSAAKHDDVVIFVENRAEKESTFYLTSPRGSLRNVLSVRSGVGYQRAPTIADKKAFEREKQSWLDRLVPEHP